MFPAPEQLFLAKAAKEQRRDCFSQRRKEAAEQRFSRNDAKFSTTGIMFHAAGAKKRRRNRFSQRTQRSSGEAVSRKGAKRQRRKVFYQEYYVSRRKRKGAAAQRFLAKAQRGNDATLSTKGIMSHAASAKKRRRNALLSSSDPPGHISNSSDLYLKPDT